MGQNYEEKKQQLKERVQELTRKNVMIAFSGGVDSSLLLKMATDAAKRQQTTVYAYTIHTMLHPMEELELTRTLANQMGAVYGVVQVDEMEEAGIEHNPKNRCYLCKKCMFQKLLNMAGELKAEVLIDGTNLDDTKVYRPGLQALTELGVISPLKEAGFSKEEVRKLAKEYGISVANRPSSPCLATRFPYDVLLSREEMKKVEKMEEKLKEYGFYNVRARVHDKLLRIEVDSRDFDKMLCLKKEIVRCGKESGYDYITLDLEGFRSGSQDLHVETNPADGVK